MLASFVGSIVASVYSSRPIRGYNLPLLSNSTSYTRYTVIIGAAIKMHLSKQISEHKILDCLKVYSGENLQKKPFVLELDSLDYIISAMVLADLSSSFTVDDLLFSELEQDNLAIQSANGLIKAIHLIKENNSPSTTLKSLKHYFPKIDKINLQDERPDLSDCSLHETVEMAIHIGLTAVSFDDTLRRCLYVGGDFDALMIIAATINELTGNEISAELKLFCKSHLSQNTPELFNMAFNAN